VANRAIDLPGHGESREPLGDLRANAASVRAAIESCPGPSILCGHSLGGASIGEAAPTDGRVRHLVYLAAVIPDVGETFAAAMGEDATPEVTDALNEEPDGAREIFYADCDAKLADWAVSMLGREHPDALGSGASRAAWRELSSTYVLCEQDRAITAPAQERLSARCQDVVRMPTSHSPMLSRPELLVELLSKLAA